MRPGFAGRISAPHGWGVQGGKGFPSPLANQPNCFGGMRNVGVVLVVVVVVDVDVVVDVLVLVLDELVLVVE